MTISQQLEEIAGEMCDKRCKYPAIHKIVNEEPDGFEAQMYGGLIGIELADSDYCRNCPLNRL